MSGSGKPPFGLLRAGGGQDRQGKALPAFPPRARQGGEEGPRRYTVQATAQARLDRDQLAKCLDAAGIDSMAYYPKLVHDYPCYHGNPQVAADETPRAALAAQQVLSLPVHPALTGADVSRIMSCVRESLEH